MGLMERDALIIGPDDPILITGATGFLGSRVVDSLLDRGFRNLVCSARPSSEVGGIEAIARRHPPATRLVVVMCTLLSREDCATATKDVAVTFHLPSGRRAASCPDAL